MSENSLELRFQGSVDVQLVETRFEGASLKSPMVCVRGKTPGALKYAGTFQWTSAVKALCILCVKTLIAQSDTTGRAIGQIMGFRGSLAASLDFALSKQPTWLTDLCGLDPRGAAYARRLILRTNPERKRPGPVILGLNDKVLPTNRIVIRWNGEAVTEPARLRELLSFINAREGSETPEDDLSLILDKIAA